MTFRHAARAGCLAAGLAAVSACAPPEASAPADAFLDPVTADPAHYALEFENDFVRVLRENLAAGAEGAMHSHGDRVSVYLNDARVTLVPADGGEPVAGQLEAGTTSWSGPVTHRGIAGDAIENLSIELKELTGPEIPLPEPDAVEVDPDHHLVDFENDRVRIVRMIYPAGFETPVHAHRRGFGVFLTDALGENVAENGDVAPIEAEARSTFWTTGLPAHVTRNLGDDDLVVILVEMKREPAPAAADE